MLLYALTVSLALISDLNGQYGSTRYDGGVMRAVQRILDSTPDLVLSLGDMIAGQRRHPQFCRTELERM